MTNWMLRGLVFGAAMVVVRLFQGTLISVWQTHAALISIVLLVLFIVGVVIWGLIDGREDAASNPDPDRREDLAMTWLLAGLIAGLLSGAVTWLIAVFYKALYVGGLINELTTFAAFTALVVFLGAITGVTIGRWRVDRAGAYKPQSGATGGDDERADTDVFAAVRSEQAATEGAEWPQEQSTAVATAEREDYQAPTAYSHEAEQTTEAVSPAASEAETKKTAWPSPSTEKTEVLPTHEPATEHIEKPKADD
jgi:hypothetical protein